MLERSGTFLYSSRRKLDLDSLLFKRYLCTARAKGNFKNCGVLRIAITGPNSGDFKGNEN